MAQVLVRNKETGQLDWMDASEAPRPKGRGSSGQTFTESRPHYSNAAGCLRHQIDEFNEQLHRDGMSASLHYEADGRLRATSKEAFNWELKRRGFYDAEDEAPEH